MNLLEFQERFPDEDSCESHQQDLTARNERYLLQGFVELDEAVFIENGGNTTVLAAVRVEEEAVHPKYARFQVVENMKAATQAHLGLSIH